jgi:hypothetical protein
MKERISGLRNESSKTKRTGLFKRITAAFSLTFLRIYKKVSSHLNLYDILRSRNGTYQIQNFFCKRISLTLLFMAFVLGGLYLLCLKFGYVYFFDVLVERLSVSLGRQALARALCRGLGCSGAAWLVLGIIRGISLENHMMEPSGGTELEGPTKSAPQTIPPSTQTMEGKGESTQTMEGKGESTTTMEGKGESTTPMEGQKSPATDLAGAKGFASECGKHLANCSCEYCQGLL